MCVYIAVKIFVSPCNWHIFESLITEDDIKVGENEVVVTVPRPHWCGTPNVDTSSLKWHLTSGWSYKDLEQDAIASVFEEGRLLRTKIFKTID